MPFRVLVADDNIDNEGNEIYRLPTTLRSAGYDVRTTPDASEAYDLVWEYHPDLIVLDILFTGQALDGVEVCRAIRLNASDIPIILVTAYLTEIDDLLRGFEAGADDYVRRPCDNREIMARIRANLPADVLAFDDCVLINGQSRSVWVCQDRQWQQVHLQPLQYDLLALLVLNAGQTVLTTTLKDRVWGKPVSDSILAVYVRRLRERLEPDPGAPVYIETIRGYGYRFSGRPTHASLEWLERGCNCTQGGVDG